jgi:hypothetical protein
MGVEKNPASGMYLHLTATMDFGYRVVEIWDKKEGFDDSWRSDSPRRPRRSASIARWRSR